MSKNPSALASLTHYTDSENEDGHDSDENSPRTEDSNESQVWKCNIYNIKRTNCTNFMLVSFLFHSGNIPNLIKTINSGETKIGEFDAVKSWSEIWSTAR